MHTYSPILNFYEFIDKIPEKTQGKKWAKMGKNRSKCVSFFVDGISETLRCGLFEQNGEKNQIEFISEYPGSFNFPYAFLNTHICLYYR